MGNPLSLCTIQTFEEPSFCTGRERTNILLLGSDAVGAAKILRRLKYAEVVPPNLTVGTPSQTHTRDLSFYLHRGCNMLYSTRRSRRFSVEIVNYKSAEWHLWDLGLHSRVPNFWNMEEFHSYYYSINSRFPELPRNMKAFHSDYTSINGPPASIPNAMVFVVDGADTARISEACEELKRAMNEFCCKPVLLVFANNQEKEYAAAPEEVADKLGLFNMADRHRRHVQTGILAADLNRRRIQSGGPLYFFGTWPGQVSPPANERETFANAKRDGCMHMAKIDWRIQGLCATSGEGLFEGFDWLYEQLHAREDLHPSFSLPSLAAIEQPGHAVVKRQTVVWDRPGGPHATCLGSLSRETWVEILEVLRPPLQQTELFYGRIQEPIAGWICLQSGHVGSSGVMKNRVAVWDRPGGPYATCLGSLSRETRVEILEVLLNSFHTVLTHGRIEEPIAGWICLQSGHVGAGPYVVTLQVRADEQGCNKCLCYNMAGDELVSLDLDYLQPQSLIELWQHIGNSIGKDAVCLKLTSSNGQLIQELDQIPQTF